MTQFHLFNPFQKLVFSEHTWGKKIPKAICFLLEINFAADLFLVNFC